MPYQEEALTPQAALKECYRHDYGRSQLVTEDQGSVNETQTDVLCHSEAYSTALPSNGADTATRNLSGNLQSQPEGLQ
ncbi:hypothetical protein O181_008179 [Austropuccinia psidii MF-1]|uniref:Uncharacterized protein n=1 Tax=Austropuccinia psidii MF-1 TaxID=1389203 RepID=A0A9Q3BM69_9BASI|nr:hypothetical protein [Austropuccinia psidii MF-1]